VEHVLERNVAVLGGQRELLRRQEHDRVLPEIAEQLVHPEHRTECVPVRTLVGREQEFPRLPNQVENPPEIAPGLSRGS